MDGGKEASAPERNPTVAQIDSRAYAEGNWGKCVGIVTAVLFIVAVTIAFFRYREHFYALESATDSNKSHAFWTILALVFAIVIAVCYFIFF
jgi:uncharacterized membrane-anchored protein